ncbi:ABC transporter permease [uncultured Nitratireductor sp.]|uniref:ABC transporter permease n=1 Tax=uncultured Nitratireductor sp. TaxID=520953 RepID=UPI0025F41B41|nr:ABC transporter permease [uncultured Nitratireductor sp.]
MMRFVLSRLITAIPTLFLVSLAVFTLIRLIPGDPVSLMLGDNVDEQAYAAMSQQLGLDRPIAMQFLIWLKALFSGDLGHSITTGEAVLPLVLHRFGISAQLVLVAVAISTVIAVPLGMVAAWRQNSSFDLSVVVGATMLMSIPTFWMGLMLLLYFGLNLSWLPVIGYVSPAEDFWAGLIYLIMPVAALVLHETGILVRMVRSSTLDVLRLDYVTHARAKGLTEGEVLRHHVLRNAFGPTWTLLGLILGNLLGGVAVVETVFTIPGLGRLIVESIYGRDYPLLQGCLLFVAITYVVVNLIVDLCYPIFDPRVKSV